MDNLQRRIKRLAWSAPHTFFAVCQPGLEQLCAQEAKDLGLEVTGIEHGGLSINGRLDIAYCLHLHSRLFSRVLLRLKEFRIRNLADFTRKLAAIAWEVYLPTNAALRLHSDLGHSHLQHGPTLQKHLMQAISQRMQAYNSAPPVLDDNGAVRIMLRTQQGRCTVSLDLTGEHLHKRGYRKRPGQAPLRETLAAAFLRFCRYQGNCLLFDPMCGSGTIALEACQIALNMAPGANREFTINSLPCHRAATWRHMRKQAEQARLAELEKAVIAGDKAPLTAARENASQLQVENYITWQQGDFWRLPAPATPGLLMINPPYGVRLGSVRQGAQLSQKLGRHLGLCYKGWQVGVLLYRPEWAQYFKLLDKQSMVLSHGGLKLTMLYGRQG